MDRAASHCRHCRFYTPEGRRGGHCGQLGVSVSGSWQSCDLCLAPFAPSWESSEVFPSGHAVKILAETTANDRQRTPMPLQGTTSEPVGVGLAASHVSQLSHLVKADR